MSRMRRSDGLLCLALFLFSILLFANSSGHGFVLDDRPLIEQNPFIRDLVLVPKLFELDYFSPRSSGLFRPLVTTSYALDFAVGGLDPVGYHRVNVVLHAVNSVLVLLLTFLLTRSRKLAAGTGFLFAALAVHTEAVASITLGRPELMAALFGLLALLGHLGARGPEGRTRPLPLGLGLLAFGLALLCKESAITLLGVVVLADFVYPVEGRPLRDRVAGPYLGFGLVALAYLGFRVTALDEAALPVESFIDNPMFALSAGWRVLNALHVAWIYVGLLVLPVHLASDYSYDQIPMITSLGDPRAVLVSIGTLAFVAVLLWSQRRTTHFFFGLAFFVITLSTASNLLVPIGTILGERLLYLPSVGFCLSAIVALAALSGLAPAPRSRAAVFIGLTAVLVAAHGWRAWERVPDWRSDDSLRLHDVEVNPRSVKLLSNAADTHLEAGEDREALELFDAAVALLDSPEQYLQASQGRVLALVGLGRYEEARALYAEVIRFGPRNPEVEAELDRAPRR